MFSLQKAQKLGIQKVRVQVKGIGKGRQVCVQVCPSSVSTVISDECLVCDLHTHAHKHAHTPHTHTHTPHHTIRTRTHTCTHTRTHAHTHTPHTHTHTYTHTTPCTHRRQSKGWRMVDWILCQSQMSLQCLIMAVDRGRPDDSDHC